MNETVLRRSPSDPAASPIVTQVEPLCDTCAVLAKVSVIATMMLRPVELV